MAAKIQRHALGITWAEQGGMARSAHALADGGRVWLIDPYEDAEALSAAAELGAPAGVVQLLDRHKRDCEAIAHRLGVPLSVLPSEMQGTPFEVVPLIANRFWNEVALWWPQRRALIVAEAIGTAPAFGLGRRAGVHPMLRLVPPRKLSRFSPELLLVGHGRAIEQGASGALEEALSRSRSDMPKLLMLPKLMRGS